MNSMKAGEQTPMDLSTDELNSLGPRILLLEQSRFQPELDDSDCKWPHFSVKNFGPSEFYSPVDKSIW